ncbi:hypothetical protein SS50377_26769 [Spironucleus salmonicida]|uniref:Uncharacterized protein n=1 Tax=Spironucleus salmonicida TaxID=348837 RepID=V6LYC5_9EUKA|nr:hypothetical protein SS50377_26769 [Spironucleus salmonicida]|eukprot:EST49238.1 hypothetical protein SS50377_10458 [Spironucleus salmonicida]
MNDDYISENTSLMANQNQYVKKYSLDRNDKNFAVVARALRDYDGLTQHIDDKFNLKQTQRAQEAEIDRLRKENIDLNSRLEQALVQQTQAEQSTEETDSRLNEQKVMIQRLLHAVKTATRHNEEGVPGQFQSLYAEFKLPHSAAMETIRHKAPEIVQKRCKHGIFDCRICGDLTGLNGDDIQLLKQTIPTSNDESNQLELKSLANRILVLQHERDAILELLSKRLADLQDEFCQIRRNAITVLKGKEELLKNNLTELISAVRTKTDNDQKCISLEQQLAHLQGKAAGHAQKARAKTEVALKQTYDEMRAFEKNKQREIQRSQQDSKMRKMKVISGMKKQIQVLNDEILGINDVLNIRKSRFDALDKRIKDVVVENELMAEMIKVRNG